MNLYSLPTKISEKNEQTNLYRLPSQISENNVIDSKDIYKYITNVKKFDHPNEEMQFIPNFIQVNRRDVRLPDTDLVNIESELRGISRNLSKVPESRYLGPNSCSRKFNDKGLCVCAHCLKKNVVNQNSRESKKKIVNNRIRPTFTDCKTRRTSSGNSNCKNNAYVEDKGMLETVKSWFF